VKMYRDRVPKTGECRLRSRSFVSSLVPIYFYLISATQDRANELSSVSLPLSADFLPSFLVATSFYSDSPVRPFVLQSSTRSQWRSEALVKICTWSFSFAPLDKSAADPLYILRGPLRIDYLLYAALSSLFHTSYDHLSHGIKRE